MKVQHYHHCRQSFFLLPDLLYGKVEEGETVIKMVIKTVGCRTVFIVISSGSTSCSLWVPITAGRINNIIGSMMRIIIKIVGTFVIVKIIIKPISTGLGKEYWSLFTYSEKTHLDSVSCRGGVEVLLTVLSIDDCVGASLCFDIKTVQ